jgi:L-seryl-tRNA(Ser) seleniumtransferase
MVEVGTTNRTRLADYAAAITPETRLLFRAHRSNFVIRGFTQEPTLAELAKLAHEHGLHLVYDLGSGLLRQPRGVALAEPDVNTALAQGADVVAFSCDKLLGGPQAGILAGSADLVSSMARSPLMRALRVGKLTLAALAPVCRGYLNEAEVVRSNPTMAMLGKGRDEIRQAAVRAAAHLAAAGIPARVVESRGQCGGGSLPDVTIPSYAVEIVDHDGEGGRRHEGTLAERLYRRLLGGDRPVLAVLREGRLLLDMLTVSDPDSAAMVAAVATAVAAETKA